MIHEFCYCSILSVSKSKQTDNGSYKRTFKPGPVHNSSFSSCSSTLTKGTAVVMLVKFIIAVKNCKGIFQFFLKSKACLYLIRRELLLSSVKIFSILNRQFSKVFFFSTAFFCKIKNFCISVLQFCNCLFILFCYCCQTVFIILFCLCNKLFIFRKQFFFCTVKFLCFHLSHYFCKFMIIL